MAASHAVSRSPLITLPDDVLAAISRQLTTSDQLLLGRLVLQQGSKAAATDTTSTVPAVEPVSAIPAASCKLLRGLRAAAASAVLSHITACTVKLPHSSSLDSLALLPNLQKLTLLVQQDSSTQNMCGTAAAVSSLAQLPALKSLKIVRPQPLSHLPFTVSLASAIGSLQRLKELSLSGVVIPARGTATAAACAQHIASLPNLKCLQAPALLSMVQPQHAVAAVHALGRLLPQLHSLKLPDSNLEGPAAAALLEGLLGCTSSSSSRESSFATSSSRSSGSSSCCCLQVLDLSGNHHMFAAFAEASACSADCSSSSSSSSCSSQANVKQTIRQGLAALVAGSSLQELLLADTGMTQDDLAAIFSSSSSGQQLVRLDVHNNRLLARGDPLLLGKCLQHLQGLQHLNISWITLGPEGVAFASCLASLRMLVMSGTRAGPAAIAALHKARPGLKCLELFDSLEANAGW
uniref:F-box domain-containing protein n=1 Tax=Tetradesmus obliquus TaxID=3088 RepID=A0A383VDL2_TETOB|eukprot:jgi/Sobl393_1/17343/SZX63043.1